SLIIMNCEFVIKEEGHLTQSENGPEVMYKEIKTEGDDDIRNADIKSETFPAGDPLAFEDTKLEMDQREEQEDGIYIPIQCSQTGENDFTCESLNDVSNKSFTRKPSDYTHSNEKPYKCS
ncbi:hypothetical protein L9F63_028116, partial [Diploptera punctata]